MLQNTQKFTGELVPLASLFPKMSSTFFSPASNSYSLTRQKTLQ